jgi:hypothetical protein
MFYCEAVSLLGKNIFRDVYLELEMESIVDCQWKIQKYPF